MDKLSEMEELLRQKPPTAEVQKYLGQLRLRDAVADRLDVWSKQHSHQRTHLELAYFFIYRRMEQTNRSIMTLFMKDTADYFLDTVSLLRVIYDTHIQFLYMLANPHTAEDYMAYTNVDLYKLIEAMKPFLPAADMQTPEFVAKEAESLAAYQKVKSRFHTKKNPPTVRNHWYSGNLDGLAKAVNYEPEYRAIHRLMSAAVHTAFWPLVNVVPIRPFSVLVFASQFMWRMTGGMALHANVTMSAEEDAMYREALTTIY